jgi:hypothetical protein
MNCGVWEGTSANHPYYFASSRSERLRPEPGTHDIEDSPGRLVLLPEDKFVSRATIGSSNPLNAVTRKLGDMKVRRSEAQESE